MIYTKTLMLPKDIWNRYSKPTRTTITIDTEKHDFNIKDRRDNGLYKGYTLIDLKDGEEVITVRFYGTSKATYCAFWLQSKKLDLYTSGTGRAFGCGYDRSSTAFNMAIKRAGVENFPRFDGSGCNREAVEWLGKILQVKKPKVVEFFE